MNTYFTRTVTFSHDEIGTIAVRKIQRCNELGEKRKRKSALREVSALLPVMDMPTYDDGIIKLFSVSLGVDVNGAQLVFATYRIFTQMELLREKVPHADAK